jgi:thiosulfate/3-mercaptopyruvate sulfurtransferase
LSVEVDGPTLMTAGTVEDGRLGFGAVAPEHLDDLRLRVFDATVQVSRRLWVPTFRSGRREWRHGHIPGSAFANLFDLSDPDRPKRTLTTPTAEWFAARAGALGIADDSQVVVYDRRENMWAARLWWMLRTFGFDNAAVLDGGWTAWQEQDYPVCTTPCGYPPATFHATVRPTWSSTSRRSLRHSRIRASS